MATNKRFFPFFHFSMVLCGIDSKTSRRNVHEIPNDNQRRHDLIPERKAMYAEECPYWKTSSSSPDTWMEKTLALIGRFGGDVLSSGFGNEHKRGLAAYLIQFSVTEEDKTESFRIVWPVLPSQKGDVFGARRQAATMMYHDVKAKCVSAHVLGYRTAFFSWLMLPDGRSMFQLGGKEILQEVPQMLLPLPSQENVIT